MPRAKRGPGDLGGPADQREAVATLLRIASWIEDEAKKAWEGCEFRKADFLGVEQHQLPFLMFGARTRL